MQDSVQRVRIEGEPVFNLHDNEKGRALHAR